jgi:hypothetical protein
MALEAAHAWGLGQEVLDDGGGSPRQHILYSGAE